MNNSVKIEDYVGMQIIHGFCSIFATGSFYFLHMSKSIILEFLEEEKGLLIEIMLGNFLHKLLNLFLFFLHEVI